MLVHENGEEENEKNHAAVFSSPFKVESILYTLSPLCRHLKLDNKKRFSTGKVYINGLEGFWSYAKERLIKQHGVSKERFPFYLKEMEFRYNNRNTEIFTQLGKYMVNLVPDLL
jgi:transposase